MRTLATTVLALALLTGFSSATHAQQDSDQATFGNVIAALNNINAQIENLEALNDLTVEDVQVVNVEDLLRGNNVRALNNAINRNETEILNLRDVLNDNEIIEDTNVVVSDVIAIDVLSGGDVQVFEFANNGVGDEEEEG